MAAQAILITGVEFPPDVIETGTRRRVQLQKIEGTSIHEEAEIAPAFRADLKQDFQPCISDRSVG